MKTKVIISILLLVIVLAVRAQHRTQQIKLAAEKIGCELIIGKDSDHVKCVNQLYTFDQFESKIQ